MIQSTNRVFDISGSRHGTVGMQTKKPKLDKEMKKLGKDWHRWISGQQPPWKTGTNWEMAFTVTENTILPARPNNSASTQRHRWTHEWCTRGQFMSINLRKKRNFHTNSDSKRMICYHSNHLRDGGASFSRWQKRNDETEIIGLTKMKEMIWA